MSHSRNLALPVVVIILVAVIALSPRQPARAATTRNTGDTILMVHGFSGTNSNGSSNGVDCQQTWGTAINYLRGSHDVNGQKITWSGPIQTIGYYTGDTNCSVNLHASTYAQHCSSYNAGNEGTNNESLYHLSCLLAWYIWLNYSQYGHNVEIVAHSMGGLITRYALYQVTRHANSSFQMGNLYISDIVTFSTPHGGVPTVSLFACGNCLQFQQMQFTSAFMNELYYGTTVNGKFIPGQNPQGANGTDWTMMGEFGSIGPIQCDVVNYQSHSATYMSGGRKSAWYGYPASGDPCYDHGGYLTDTSDAYNTQIQWCDGCNVADPSTWNYLTTAPHSLHHMLYALYLPNW